MHYACAVVAFNGVLGGVGLGLVVLVEIIAKSQLSAAFSLPKAKDFACNIPLKRPYGTFVIVYCNELPSVGSMSMNT